MGGIFQENKKIKELDGSDSLSNTDVTSNTTNKDVINLNNFQSFESIGDLLGSVVLKQKNNNTNAYLSGYLSTDKGYKGIAPDRISYSLTDLHPNTELGFTERITDRSFWDNDEDKSLQQIFLGLDDRYFRYGFQYDPESSDNGYEDPTYLGFEVFIEGEVSPLFDFMKNPPIETVTPIKTASTSPTTPKIEKKNQLFVTNNTNSTDSPKLGDSQTTDGQVTKITQTITKTGGETVVIKEEKIYQEPADYTGVEKPVSHYKPPPLNPETLPE